jgi:hypothetical protein
MPERLWPNTTQRRRSADNQKGGIKARNLSGPSFVSCPQKACIGETPSKTHRRALWFVDFAIFVCENPRKRAKSRECLTRAGAALSARHF